jgi:cobalt/nickel transport system permease protein
MHTIQGTLLDFRQLEQLASGNSHIHRLDPRVKILTTLVFSIAVISFDKLEISSLLPFILFPVVLSAQASIPPGYILKKLALVIPFAIMIGIFNPLFDRTVVATLGPLDITGGWMSFLSIILRTTLTVSAALLLVSVTGFNNICQSLSQMGVPQVFTTQLLFLYRYIFVLTEEVSSISRAYALRSINGKKMNIRVLSSLLGNLLLRTWERAERIHLAMLSRGYNGLFINRKTDTLRRNDLIFLCSWSLFFTLMRFNNLPELLGRIVTGLWNG